MKWKQILTQQFYYFILFPTFIITGYLLIYKNYPPSFPLPKSEEILDCFNINVTSVSSSSNKIEVNISFANLIQYPHLVAPYLLHVKTKAGNIEHHFNAKSFWDFQTTEKTSSFQILSKVTGNISVEVMCQDLKLAYKKLNIISTEPTIVQGYTHFMNDENLSRTLKNICINKSQITIFDETELDDSQKDKITYNAAEKVSLAIKHVPDDISSFLPVDSYSFSDILIVPSSPNDGASLILDALLPIYIHNQKKGIHPIFFIDQNNSLLSSYVSMILPQPKVALLTNKGTQCTQNAYLLKTTGTKDLITNHIRTKEEQLEKLMEENVDFSKFRSYFDSIFSSFASASEKREKAVIVSNSIIEAKMRKECKDCKFYRIDDNIHFSKLISRISFSQYFIPAETGYDFLYMIWLDHNSTVITKKGTKASKFAEKLGLKVADKIE